MTRRVWLRISILGVLALAGACSSSSDPSASGDGDDERNDSVEAADGDHEEGEIRPEEEPETDGDAGEIVEADEESVGEIEAEVEQDAASESETEPEVESRGILFVVTTNYVVAHSRKLSEFVATKEAMGFVVTVATETQYGAADAAGADRAVAIREWLKANRPAEGDAYALLIGDAHPIYGDVPMFVVWPRHTYPEDNCAGAFALDCRSMESDMPYADLTGNWDLNGDGSWGQHELDDGEGGIDFTAELIVGRIPTYFNDMNELDTILSHAIDYPRQAAAETAYRQKILLPAAFYYFKGQAMASYTMIQDVDGAEIPEWFASNVLADHPEITATRMYEKEGLVQSEYACEIPLADNAVAEAWSDGYGMVWWFGHGLDRGVYRTIWTEDGNDNGRPDGNEVQSPYLFNSDQAALLPAGKPAFVVAVSCEVGSAETPQNLAYALLLSGGAIGVVGSTNVTPGDATDYADPGSELDTGNYGASNLGVLFFEDLLNGEVAGKALFKTKVTLGQSGDIEAYAGKMMLNYLGDPTLSLTDHGG